MRNFRLLGIILMLGFLFALGPISAQDQCNCQDQFEKMVEYIEKNYPFYKLKVTAENQKSMNAYNKLFLKKKQRDVHHRRMPRTFEQLSRYFS